LTSLLLPPKCDGQEVINLCVVNQSEFLQDGHFDWATSQLLHRKELVYCLEDPDIIVFFHIVIVEEASILPYSHSIVGHKWAGGPKTQSRVLPDPNDRGMLDVVGFDTTVPAVIADFVRE